MGLPMDDIHTPTVPSGPASSHTTRSTNKDDGKTLLDLIADKSNLEEELKALSGVLDSHGVTMDTSLTTFDGYPRDDLDVAQIRTIRARIIRLRNDYKGLLSKIEDALHAHHAQARNIAITQPHASSPASSSAGGGQVSGASTLEAPFARVNGVVAGSPAEAAGLRLGDKICRFGDIDWVNHEKLSKVAEAVQRNEGVIHTPSKAGAFAADGDLGKQRSIVVKIQRNNTASSSPERLQLSLIPRGGWGGRGLLGCHLLPL
ncbi:MAG: hypothetical protein Q9207_005435 [Kuettlingeria erythrocarpa]